MATTTVSLTQMRPRLSELVERAHSEFGRFLITRRGRTEAILLSSEEFDGLLETLEILSDEGLVERLAAAEEELASGGGHALEEVRREVRRGDRSAVEPG